ncbi:MAG: hypothetical protein JST64_09945 [Actinobacteria bacterium]|nr:hypothetical protein [Actinomycetota bacterium]
MDIILTGDFPNSFQASAAGAGATQEVSGLGDRAFASPAGGPAGTIIVLKGNTSLRIDVSQPTDLAVLRHLAETALSRL